MTPSSAATTRTAMSVAGRVEEGDLAAVGVHLVGADVLRDPAGLRLDDRRLPNRVEQRRLAVVDVAHDRDDRRPLLERLGRVVEDLRSLVLLRSVLDRELAVGGELGGDQLDVLVRKRLRDGDRLSEPHHEHHDLGRLDAQRLRQVPDGHPRGDGDGTRRRRGGLLLRPRPVLTIARLARVPAADAAALDHDAALAPLAGRALARPDRAVGTVWT
jgi:hypothetical protein